MNRLKNGFTLVELIVVIAVIGIVASISVLGLTRYQADTRDAKRASSATVIVEALEKYYDQNGEYPSCGALSANANIVSSTTLKGIDEKTLVAPQAPTATSNSLSCSQLTANGVDLFQYVGDGSASCNGSGACSSYTLKYKDESGNTIKSIESRKKSVVAVDPGGPIVVPGTSFPKDQVAKLLASDGATDDRGGWSVDIDGDTAVIGAPYDNDGASKSGSAYIFIRSGNSWIQQSKLTISNGGDGDQFGTNVAISGDTVAISARNDRSTETYFDANVFIFTRSGSSWTQQAKLHSPGGSYFGDSIDISGNTLVIGESGMYDNNNHGMTGWIYVYTRSGSSWTQQAKFAPTNGFDGDRVGMAVAISGNTLVIGSRPGNCAYVYTRSGSSWTQQAKLSPGSGNPGYFGSSVAISGNTIAIGTISLQGIGASYIFARSGSSWTQQALLTASDGTNGDQFGTQVSVSGDTAVIGAAFTNDKGSKSGSAYVFTRSGSSWTQRAKLTASDGAEDDKFGTSVAISGSTALVGAPYNTGATNNSGSAYIFQ